MRWVPYASMSLAFSIGLNGGHTWAQTPAADTKEGSAAVSRDDKLPAQLPTLTIQGRDLSGSDPHGVSKIVPMGGQSGSLVRLPEPVQRRATSDDNRRLVVSVTPSTIEPPPALTQARMPYTTVVGGLGFPGGQFRGGLYDARYLGSGVLCTELNGRSGSGWSGWRAKEWLQLPRIGRVDLQADAFAWTQRILRGNQSFF